MADQISASQLIVLPVLLEAAVIYWILTSLLDGLRVLLERRIKLSQ